MKILIEQKNYIYVNNTWDEFTENEWLMSVVWWLRARGIDTDGKLNSKASGHWFLKQQ